MELALEVADAPIQSPKVLLRRQTQPARQTLNPPIPSPLEAPPRANHPHGEPLSAWVADQGRKSRILHE